jgi:RNA polymerase sigma factor (sigma-70 family)
MPSHGPDPKVLTDAELIRACADDGNDDACWLEFVERYQSLLTRSAVRAYRRFTRGGYPPHWRVAEFVQETYLRLLRNDRELLRRLRGETESAAKAYLTNIALNTVGDLLREEFAQKRHSEMTSLEDAHLGKASWLAKEFAIPEGIADRDLLKLLTNYSAAPQVSRDVVIFLLHVRAGLTAEEIADSDFVQLKPASVTSILIRTRNRLKKALEKAA